MLEDRTVPTTIKLTNLTGLAPSVAKAWVAGFNGNGNTNGLAASTTTSGQGSFSASTQDFYQIGSSEGQIDSITLNEGQGRLIFVVAQEKPPTLPLGTSFVPAPYRTGHEPPTQSLTTGPMDFFEFAYNGNDDLSAANGFGLNLSFTVANINGTGATETYGADPSFDRGDIGKAYTMFMTNEGLRGKDYLLLLYKTTPGSANVPVPGNQFFAIVDPADWINNTPPEGDGLVDYWNETVENFFKPGNFLSINLSAGAVPNIYEGYADSSGYTLTSLTDPMISYNFPKPEQGLASANYVFQQDFTVPPPPDFGQLQDQIWEALSRGVALDGAFNAPPGTSLPASGFSTTAWNDHEKWYTVHTSPYFPGITNSYNTYAKFLHYSTIKGKDSRTCGCAPIFIGNAAYGFPLDENPDGPYTGPQVPSKTMQPVGPNDTLTITLGPWASRSVSSTVAVGLGQGGVPLVRVFDAATKAQLHEVRPYSRSFRGGVRAAAGDVNGDGVFDFVTAPGPGMRPLVKVYDGTNGDLIKAFLVYPKCFVDGVFVALGDLDGDGKCEVLVGPGKGAYSVRAYTIQGTALPGFAPFHPYGKRYSGGIHVAMGNTDGVFGDEIAVAPADDGQKVVRIYKSLLNASKLLLQVNPYPNHKFSDGIWIALGDVIGPPYPVAQLITAPGSQITPWNFPLYKEYVKLFDSTDGQLIIEHVAFPGFTGGTRVGVADSDGVGPYELITARGPTGSPVVKIWAEGVATGLEAFPPSFTEGLYVS